MGCATRESATVSAGVDSGARDSFCADGPAGKWPRAAAGAVDETTAGERDDDSRVGLGGVLHVLLRPLRLVTQKLEPPDVGCHGYTISTGHFGSASRNAW